MTGRRPQTRSMTKAAAAAAAQRGSVARRRTKQTKKTKTPTPRSRSRSSQGILQVGIQTPSRGASRARTPPRSRSRSFLRSPVVPGTPLYLNPTPRASRSRSRSRLASVQRALEDAYKQGYLSGARSASRSASRQPSRPLSVSRQRSVSRQPSRPLSVSRQRSASRQPSRRGSVSRPRSASRQPSRRGSVSGQPMYSNSEYEFRVPQTSWQKSAFGNVYLKGTNTRLWPSSLGPINYISSSRFSKCHSIGRKLRFCKESDDPNACKKWGNMLRRCGDVYP